MPCWKRAAWFLLNLHYPKLLRMQKRILQIISRFRPLPAVHKQLHDWILFDRHMHAYNNTKLPVVHIQLPDKRVLSERLLPGRIQSDLHEVFEL